MSAKPTAPADLRALASTCAGRTGRQAAFAAFVGWDKSHVTRLKQLGQLELTTGGLVDFPASLRRIADNADPARDAQRQAAADRRPAQQETAPAQPAAAPDTTPEADADKPDDVDGPKYSAARATKEYWSARTAQVEYERLTGELVRRTDMDKAVADAAMQFRQAVENQPHRLADRLVGLTLDEIRTRLRDDGQQMLAELSRGFAKRMQQLTAP
jgi:hypothetical protein